MTPGRRTPRAAALGLALAACATASSGTPSGGGAPTGAAVPAGPWDPDDRVIVTDFQRVTALARSPDRLFAATDGGLVVLEDAFGRWELPLTREDGWPDSQVLSLVWDTRDGTLWMGTRDGRLLQLDMFGRRWRDGFGVGFAPTRIVPSTEDASTLYARSADRWVAVDPFARDVRPVRREQVERSIRANFDLRARAELIADPTFQAAEPFLGRRGNRDYEVTDVMPAAGRAGAFWVGTYGGFIERYDGFGAAGEPLAYGVVGQGAGAVLAEGGTVWIAPRFGSDRYGVAATDPSLVEWRTFAAESYGFDAAPSDPVRAFAVGPGGTWAGGERGLHRWDGDSWHREPLGARAGDAPITALTAGVEGVDGLDGLWVGTERGLFRVAGPGAGPAGASVEAVRVRDLVVVDGRLWAGTDAGLLRIGPTGPIPSPFDPPPGRVGALAADGTRLVAGIERDVWVLDPASGWSRAGSLGVLPARVTALAVRDGVVWVGSDEGLAAWDTRTDQVAFLTFAAGDLPPGPRGERGVFDLAIDGEGGIWAATPAGAVRLGAGR